MYNKCRMDNDTCDKYIKEQIIELQNNITGVIREFRFKPHKNIHFDTCVIVSKNPVVYREYCFKCQIIESILTNVALLA